MRIGIGYDIHKLVTERTLYLGGIKIDYPKGLLGHSDGDVLLHALVDALLGAAGLGDIGEFFPDNDPAYKGANSVLFVENIVSLLTEKHNFEIINIDCTIFARAPKLGSVREDIRKNLAWLLHIEPGATNVKFKTMNDIGLVGRGEAIAAEVAVLIREV